MKTRINILIDLGVILGLHILKGFERLVKIFALVFMGFRVIFGMSIEKFYLKVEKYRKEFDEPKLK